MGKSRKLLSWILALTLVSLLLPDLAFAKTSADSANDPVLASANEEVFGNPESESQMADDTGDGTEGGVESGDKSGEGDLAGSDEDGLAGGGESGESGGESGANGEGDLAGGDEGTTEDAFSEEAPDPILDEEEALEIQAATELPAGVAFDTPYIIRPANASTRVLDIYGSSKTAGAALIIWDSHMRANQRFVFEDAGDGYVFIRCLATGLYLDITGASSTRGTAVIQWTWHGRDNQRWQLSGSLADGLTITSALSPDIVLDIYGAASTNGAKLIIWTPTGRANQHFYLIDPSGAAAAPGVILPEGDGVYAIVNTASDKVLDIPGGSAASDLQPTLWTEGAKPWQFFLFTEEDGYYRIMPLSSNKPLGAAGGNVVVGTAVTTQPDTAAASQRFAVEGDPTNGYVVRNKASGLVFDIWGGATTNGAKLILWNANGHDNQNFSLNKVSDADLVSSLNGMLSAGYYQVHTDGGLALDLTGQSKLNGANIELWTANSGNAQKWLSDVPEPGVFTIRNAGSGRALDIEGSSMADGANVLQWTPNGNSNQHWSLEYAGEGYFYIKSAPGTYLSADEPRVAGSNVFSSGGVARALRVRFERTSFALGITIISDIRSQFQHGYKGPEYTRYIMLHDTEGTGGPQNVIDWWARPGNGIATHFIVGRDGSIWQAVSMNQIAWHAGVGSAGKAALFDVRNDGRDEAGNYPSTPTRSYGMNSWSIGIEMVHVGGGAPYTAAQLDALDDLIAYIDRSYGFQATIIDHKAWAVSNSDTSAEFAPYLSNYQRYRHH